MNQLAKRQSADWLERYWTHPWQTRALFAYAGIPTDICVIEPCAGAGWMVDVLAEHVGRERIAAFDVAPERDDITQADTLMPGFFELIAIKYHDRQIALITNPPFSALASYLRRGQSFEVVALLGRLSWLEPTKDREDCPNPDLVIVLPRSGFGGPYAKKGTDSVTVAWFVWGSARKGIVRVRRSEVPRLKAGPLENMAVSA